MERGLSARQPGSRGGAVVPAKSYQLPLLPFERDLIATLGISEEEYREFAKEVESRVRYELLEGVPVADAVLTPILINLAIGVVLTGVSMLLAPKPARQSAEKQERKTFEISSQNGRTKFNNSVGFDGAPALAALGSRVPIPFGMYEPEIGHPDGGVFRQSGGIIVEPLLVWSRMTSHGSFQTIKLLTVLGQAQIEETPKLEGIFIGGQTVSNFAKTNYWVGYKSIKGENRIRLVDGKYGEAAEGNDSPAGIFACPTLDGGLEAGFSMAYTPANTTSFGVYQTIPNGGNWRLNWEVVGFPKLENQEDDPIYAIRTKRKKIAGENAKQREDGMKGIGRPYSNKCGLIAHNEREYDNPTELTVSIGDRLSYLIDGGQFRYDNTSLNSDSEVGIEDLNSVTNSLRETVDDYMQVGEVLLCNRTLMRVKSRPNTVWRYPESHRYELEVIGFTGANRTIGIIGKRNLQDFVLGEGGNEAPYDTYKGTGWYSLSKVDFGSVKNTRATEVTEIGIRANVWARANGLFNFNETPTPKKLEELDEEGYSITGGTINKYMRRTAFFMLAVRDPNNIKGYDNNTENSIEDDLFEGFDILGDISFAVTGSAPVDQFSFIRIVHPGKMPLEFRLIPKPSATIIQFKESQNPQVYVLNTAAPLHSKVVDSPHYGKFQLLFSASMTPLTDLFDLPEMQAGTYTTDEVLDCSNAEIGVREDTPGSGGGQLQAFFESFDGSQWNLKPHGTNSNKNVYGQTRSFEFDVSLDGVEVVRIRANGTVVDAGGEDRLASHGTAKAWAVGFQLVSGNPRIGARYSARRDTSKTWHYHWFRFFPASVTRYFYFDSNGNCVVVEPAKKFDREFEDNAAIKELSPYQEISKSCDDSPEFSIAYVNESVDCTPEPDYFGLSMLGFKLRSMNRAANVNQVQVWLPNGISVERLQPQIFPDGKAYGPSNSFADLAYYLLSSKGAGEGGLGREVSDKLIAKGWFELSARFMDNYWMRYDGAVVQPTNVRDFLTELAPMFLCNFVMINGKFALTPALPMDGDMLNEGPISPAMMFNDGTIVDGSFKLTYLPQADRQDFRANMIYRVSQPNALVEKRSISVRWKWDENFDGDPNNDVTTVNQEDYDISEFCTRRSHAYVAARYMLSARRRVDHTIEFLTTPTGLSLAPGDFIRVESQMSPYENFQNGVVRADGSIVSAMQLADGTHKAYVHRPGSEDVELIDITVKNNRVTDPSLGGSLFNVPNIARRLGVYQVETIGIEDDGLVKITGSHHPVFEDMRSKIVYDIMHPDEQFVIAEEILS